MRLRPRRRSLVVLNSFPGRAGSRGAGNFTPPVRSRRLYRQIRNGALFTIIGVIRLSRIAWARWLVAGAVLTVVGVVWRGDPGGVVLLPGLLCLAAALLTPSGPQEAARVRRCDLARELAAYSTQAQRQDLEAILDRYPDGATCELRDILASHPAAAHDTRWPAAGRY
jgi:hypothetical protein